MENYLLGNGGHAGVCLDVIRDLGEAVSGFVLKEVISESEKTIDPPFAGDETWLICLEPTDITLINGVGQTAESDSRAKVFAKFKAKDFVFRTIIHPSASVTSKCSIAEGAQIMRQVAIQSDVSVGKNTIINTGAIIDHDTQIGNNVHIAPGAVLCGGVSIGDHTMVGAGSTVIEGVEIGERCIIGAGSLVLKDVPDGTVYINKRTVMRIP